MTEFEEYLMENSHLEFGYLWTGGKWMVSSWTTTVEGTGPYAEYNSTWNGFSWLVTSFVREGRKTVQRLRNLALYADELEVVVEKWHRYGMGEIVAEHFETA